MEETKFLEEQIREAPKEIRNFLAQKEWRDAVQKIIQKNNFSSDQQTALENEIIFVILDLEPREGFKENIINSVGIQEIMAREIELEVNQNIFNKINRPTTPENKKIEPVIETPDLPSFPPAKSTALEIPPQMSIVPEGKVMDHLPPIHPTQPKIVVPPFTATPAPAPTPVVPVAQAPKPIVQTPAPTIRYAGKDPYREPLE
jgi:hypothetical protein